MSLFRYIVPFYCSAPQTTLPHCSHGLHKCIKLETIKRTAVYILHDDCDHFACCLLHTNESSLSRSSKSQMVKVHAAHRSDSFLVCFFNVFFFAQCLCATPSPLMNICAIGRHIACRASKASSSLLFVTDVIVKRFACDTQNGKNTK